VVAGDVNARPPHEKRSATGCDSLPEAEAQLDRIVVWLAQKYARLEIADSPDRCGSRGRVVPLHRCSILSSSSWVSCLSISVLAGAGTAGLCPYKLNS
jgi:hypothetical protein